MRPAVIRARGRSQHDPVDVVRRHIGEIGDAAGSCPPAVEGSRAVARVRTTCGRPFRRSAHTSPPLGRKVSPASCGSFRVDPERGPGTERCHRDREDGILSTAFDHTVVRRRAIHAVRRLHDPRCPDTSRGGEPGSLTGSGLLSAVGEQRRLMRQAEWQIRCPTAPPRRYARNAVARSRLFSDDVMTTITLSPEARDGDVAVAGQLLVGKFSKESLVGELQDWPLPSSLR